MVAVVSRVLAALRTVGRAFPISFLLSLSLSTAKFGTSRWVLGLPEGLSPRLLHASHKFHGLQRRHARYLAPQCADTFDVAVRY